MRVAAVGHYSEMTDAPLRVRARVRHEPDRSYAVLVQSPDGEVLVGITRSTGELGDVACQGAARLYGMDAGSITWANLDLVVPRPPYGEDGQWVRIIAVENSGDASELELLGAAGQASWFGHEGAWFVTVPGPGTQIIPSECLDFEPVLSPEEATTLLAYINKTTSG